MNKYIPKVGEAFQFYSDTFGYWVQCGKVVAETHTEIAYLIGLDGEIRTLKKDRRFFPTSTKSDLERDNLLKIIENCLENCIENGMSIMACEIQHAGFTIPKKVKRSDISHIIFNSIQDVTEHQAIHAANKICDLLGDLVEQDDKGGEL
jgi:hypothetical protein